ncbi:MAG: hypothetical protein ACHQ17_01355 [Polyangia bacterium]|jgi:hypothetical protein
MDPEDVVGTERRDFEDEDTLELDPASQDEDEDVEDDGTESTWEWDGSGWRKVG